jgi:hypothetical protein
LLGRALQDVLKEAEKKGCEYSYEEIGFMSPMIANVSLIVPVKINGEYFLVSQIKGKAVGSGQVLGALVAGGVDCKDLKYKDPLVKALNNECFEEIGLDLSCLNSSSFVYMVDERELGSVNFSAIAERADLTKILGSYEKITKEKLSVGEELEVMALSKFRISGFTLVPLEDGSQWLKDVICYFPTKKGLVKKTENRAVRPYTQATLDYISKPENVRFLLEKAGF